MQNMCAQASQDLDIFKRVSVCALICLDYVFRFVHIFFIFFDQVESRNKVFLWRLATVCRSCKRIISVCVCVCGRLLGRGCVQGAINKSRFVLLKTKTKN